MANLTRKRREEHVEITERVEELLGDLEDPDPGRRLEGWTGLATTFRAEPRSASRGVILRLVNQQDTEKDIRVWRAAYRAINLALLQLQEATRRSRRGRAVADLGEWLWQHFRGDSRVFHLADPERFRRDEEAVIEIARSLSLAEFPRTKFICVEPGEFAGVLADLDEVNAICFVGRLRLFGEDAMEYLGNGAFASRYRFGLDVRPPDLPRGKLHPEYHAIVRQATESENETWYRTCDSKGKRTDYGLVQRYVVTWNGRRRVVIVIAGCSSLGTQAAAHYAAYTLLQPELEDKMLPVPQGAKEGSCVEILVSAVADVKGSELGWRIRDLKPLDLSFNEHAWSQEENCWYVPKHDVIRMIFPSERAVQNYRQYEEGAEIFFDGQRYKFRRKSENSRLCTALCMLAADQLGLVRFSQLGEDVWIWNDHEPKSERHVRNRLGNLCRVMGKSLVIDGAECRVIPEIRVGFRSTPEPTPPAMLRPPAKRRPARKRKASGTPKPR